MDVGGGEEWLELGKTRAVEGPAVQETSRQEVEEEIGDGLAEKIRKLGSLKEQPEIDCHHLLVDIEQ